MEANCGLWTISKAGTKGQEVIRFTENLCGTQSVDLTFLCEYEHYNQNHLKLQNYQQEAMTVDFDAGETNLLTFQAPKFKYDLWDLVQDYGDSTDYIKEEILLPDDDMPSIQLTRAIYFKI